MFSARVTPKVASALEDLARKLEADGKEQIAASLRNRIVHSEADNTGARGMD